MQMVPLEWFTEAALPLTYGPPDRLQCQRYLSHPNHGTQGFPEYHVFEGEDKEFNRGPEPQVISCK